MGLFTHEFIDIIDWPDQDPNTLVWKFPRFQNEIKMNAKLTVREGQQAVFLNEGKIADVFMPGMYTLQTQNMPILTTLKGWKYGFNSPFKADVLFVSTRNAIDQKWGTKNAITVSDERFGLIELRAFGTYAVKITDAGKFIREIAGVESEYTTEEIAGQIRSLIATHFSRVAGSGIPIDKFALNLESLSTMVQEKLNADFDLYGLQITRFVVENVSMPDDLKKEIFEYSRLDKIDIQKLTQFKISQNIETIAENEGMTGMGAAMGVGLGMGRLITDTVGDSLSNMQAPAGPPPIVQYFTGTDGKQAGPYDIGQLRELVTTGSVKRNTLIWKQGMAAWTVAENMPELDTLFSSVPPPLP